MSASQATRDPLLLIALQHPGAPTQTFDDPASQQLVSDARRHGLSGVLQNLVDREAIVLSPSASLVLKRDALATAAIALRVKRLLFRALDVLQTANADAVVLKGYPLAARIYPEPLRRMMSDVDLLVAPEHIDQSVSALVSLGLTPHTESDEYYPPEYQHHVSLHGPAGLVELHYRVSSGLGARWATKDLLANAETIEVDGRTLKVLRPEDELVFLCIHATNHMLQRLSWVWDLRLFLERYPALNWSEVVRSAAQSGVPEFVFYALEASQRTFGAAVPDEVLEQLHPGWFRRFVSERCFSGEALVAQYLELHKNAWAAAKLVLTRDWKAGVRFSARRVAWSLEH